jgi:hypothetical protein
VGAVATLSESKVPSLGRTLKLLMSVEHAAIGSAKPASAITRSIFSGRRTPTLFSTP